MRRWTPIFLCLFLAGCFGTDEVLSGGDRGLMTRGVQRSLESNKNGETLQWTARQSTHRGTVTPLETYHAASGRPCRRYRQSLSVAGETRVAEDTACRGTNGRWVSINQRAPAGHATFAARQRRSDRYDGGDALLGLLLGLTYVGVHHGVGHHHFGHHWRLGHFRFRH